MIRKNAKRIGTFVAIVVLLYSWYLLGMVPSIANHTPGDDLALALFSIVFIPFCAVVVGFIAWISVMYVESFVT